MAPPSCIMTIPRPYLIAGALLCLGLLLLGAGCCSTSSTITPAAETSRPYYTIAPTAATSAPVATLSRMSTAPTTREPTPEAADLQLTLVSHDWKRTGEKPYQSIYVAGSAKNTGSKKISSGFVEVKWFDKARNVLGTSLGSADNLEPGETMRFEIMYIGSTPAAEVDSYKISVDKLYNYD